ncbi:hypothetical protein MD537_08370 [Flavihumibacter sediminis]|nr:hypothetical protein [Flavihumibacter sediminis]
MIEETIIPALSDYRYSDVLIRETVDMKQAEELFSFFQQHPLFRWGDANNGCEGRADAVCVLLDEWGIPNYKGWAFSGAYLRKHIGELKQNWKYHVAPVLAIEHEGVVKDFVLDPATASFLRPIDDWAASITLVPHSYYFTRQSSWYIFPSSNIRESKWNSRNRQNRKWMIQCLAGINSLRPNGRAALIFNKSRLRNTQRMFEQLKRQRPF